MTSEPKDFVKPTRYGRMTGVNISIDGDTWEYVLNHAKIPIDTPLTNIRIRRYRSKHKCIILKISVEPCKNQSKDNIDMQHTPNTEIDLNRVKNDFDDKTDVIP